MAITNRNLGSFIPSTYILDVDQIRDVDVNSQDFKELLVRLYQNLNQMLLVINRKDTGVYDTNDFVNGQTYFANPALSSSTPTVATPRQVYRKVINFGALPNTTSKSVNHNIPIVAGNPFSFTRIYATASDQSGNNYIPIPYSSVSSINNNIELSVNATQVTITTGSNRSNFTICYVVLEHIKS